MRIAVIAPPWLPVPPVSYGGTEIVLDALCRGLEEIGHEVLLVTTHDSTCQVSARTSSTVSLGTVSTPAAAEVPHAAHGYEQALAWGAEIVHDHTLTGPALGALVVPAPVVTTCHGPLDGRLRSFYRSIADRVAVIAISASQARLAPDVAVSAVIHHGVDLTRFTPAEGRGEAALFLGRMSPDKGVDTAIEVARRAGVPLQIAAKMAEDDERQYFAECIRPLLGDGVEYLGEVTRVQQRGLIAGARCLLNPIRWGEPFGMVVIEALASGTPVVTTPCGSMPELVDDGITGFLRTDVAGLAAAVVASAALPGSVCRAVAETRFSMRRMAEDHVQLFERVLDEQRAFA